MQKKFILSFLMVGFASTPISQAAEWINKRNILIATSVFLAPYIYRYVKKKDVLKRYNIDELKHGNDLLSNLSYLLEDGFFGTPPKEEVIKLKGEDDGGKVTWEKSPKRDGTGVVGTIHTNLKPILSVAAWIAALWALFYYEKIIDLNSRINFAHLYDIVKDPAAAVKLLEAATAD